MEQPVEESNTLAEVAAAARAAPFEATSEGKRACLLQRCRALNVTQSNQKCHLA